MNIAIIIPAFNPPDSFYYLLQSISIISKSTIIIADDDSLENYDPVKFSSIITQVVEQTNATRVLMVATTMGKDLGPRLAAELDWGYLGDCLEAGDEGFVRPNFAGKVLAKSNPTNTVVVSIRNNAYFNIFL